jgi:DNA recombination protein RmuC
MKQLSTGRGNLVGQAEKLREMGASSSKQLPDSLTGQSSE